MNDGIERPLPHSKDAERGILGALLVGNAEAGALLDRLTAEDFFLPQHRHVFAAAQKLYETHKPIDLLSVHEILMHAGDLEAAGGIAYVAELGDGVPRVSSLAYYAETIKAYAVRRRIIYKAYAIYEAGFAARESEEVLLDRSIESLSEIARDRESDQDFGTTYQAAASRLLAEFDAQDGVRIFTDVDELDRLTGGFRAGELVLFTAETASGKHCSHNRRAAAPAVRTATRFSVRVRCERNT